ncbi:MAG: ABC transporter substrate-binding protein [Deltaproteobacteria bacterium]|nr:ABC transporter substrate-binding protein [Deltaproteobacteria bacterium]
MDKIKIGIGTSSIGRFLPYIGQAAGLFEQAGLAVEIVNQLDEEKVVTDIVSGETPIGTPNAPSLIFSLLEDNDLVIVGGVLNRPAFFLAATSSIRTIADLKGKKIGINQPRRMAGMVMLALLRRWGIDGQRDLTLVDGGVNDRTFEALQKSDIVAALLPPEKAFFAEAQGFKIVADSHDLDCHWVPLVTTRRFLAQHGELVKKVAAVYVESIAYYRRERGKACEEISRQLPVMQKHPAVLAKCYDVFAAGFEPSLTASVSSIDAALREVTLQDARAGNLSAQSFVVPMR